MSEKTFTVVGTACNPNGVTKVRWANDLITRLKILIKANCSNIDLHELPHAMNKFDAVKWLMENVELSSEQQEAVSIKYAEKKRDHDRGLMQVSLSANIKSAVDNKKSVDSATLKTINRSLENV